MDAGEFGFEGSQRARRNADAEWGRRDGLAVIAGMAGRTARRAITAFLLVRTGGRHLRAVGKERISDEVRKTTELGEQAENADV